MSTPTPEDRKLLAEIAAECGLARDYHKECWIAVYAGGTAAGLPSEHCAASADRAVARFKRVFPS